MVWCLALALSAASLEPQAVVLVTRRTGLTLAESDALSRELSAQLVKQNVPLKLDADAGRAAFNRLGLKDSAACDGKKRCIAELARQLGAQWVIGLSFAKLGADLSIGLELIRESTSSVVEKDALVLASGTTPTAEQLESFARKLRGVLGTTAPVASDVPVVAPPEDPKPKLTPDPPPPPPPVVIVEAAPRSHAASIGLGVGAAASVIAGATLIIVGALRHADLQPTVADNGERLSKYSASQAVALANSADAEVGTGIGFGVLGLALGTGAVLAW